MRRLFPGGDEHPLDTLYRDLVLPRPAGDRLVHLAVSMVASVDGAVSVDGLSGGLGGDGDRRAFRALRAAGDVVLVGAGTVRAERYGPVKLPAEVQRVRRERGLAPLPRLAVLTASGRLDPGLPLFTSATAEPPLVLTGAAADPDALQALVHRAEVHVLAGEADLAALPVLERLADLGLTRVVCEGGPSLNQLLLAAGVVDELFLTIAPTLLGGPAGRIIAGKRPVPQALRLRQVHEHDGDLLLRYQRADAPETTGGRP